MKFVTDGMLGKLTRWLRLAGEDVICINDHPVDPEQEDETLLDLASEKSRVLLTRDIDLHRQALKNNVKSILIEEEGDVAKQMITISENTEKNIQISIENSRCPVCNGKLKPIEKSTISKNIPELVLEKNDKFWKCKKCGKIYWPGSHWEKITETVERYQNLKK